MVGDLPHIGQAISIPAQYGAANAQARELFKRVVEADRDRRDTERDDLLQSILGFPGEAVEDPKRVGNSMPDLRLSVKGWRFGQEVRNGYGPDGALQTRREAANWLRREVYDPSRTKNP